MGKKIHRLIAQHYLKPPSEDLIERCKTIYPFMVCINHKDGNKLNNALNNLEWCSHVDNSKHAWATGLVPALKGSLNGRATLTEDLVHSLCKFYEEGGTPLEAQAKFTISRSQSTKIRAGIQWKHIHKQYNIKVNHRSKSNVQRSPKQSINT